MQHIPLSTVPTGRPYVSCIRIDGVPIMPPFMTDKRREEMRHYRDLAIARERQLRHARQCSTPIAQSRPATIAPIPAQSLPLLAPTDRRLSISELSANAPHHMDDYLSVSRLLDQQQRFAMVTSMVAACCDDGGGGGGDADAAATSSTCGADDDTTLGNVSDITTDQANEADIEENDDDDDVDEEDGDSSTVQLTAFVQQQTTNVDAEGEDGGAHSDSTSAATLHSTIVIHSPDGEDFIESSANLCVQMLERSASIQMPNTSGVDVDDSNARPRLIRSNSYTLDTPSPAFLKHLQSQGVEVLKRRSVSDATIAVDPNGSAGLMSMKIEVPAMRRQSFDAQTKADRRCKAGSKFSVVKAKPASITSSGVACNSGGRVQTSRTARRASFERVYGAKVSVVNVSLAAAATLGEKKSLANPAKPSTQTQHQAQRIRRVYDPKSTPPKSQRPQSVVVSSPVPKIDNTISNVAFPTHSALIETAEPVASSVSPPASTSARSSDHSRIVDMIGRMETDRRRQMDELIARQETEQRRLQEAFMQQQQLLVQQITANCSAMIETCQQNVAIQLARQSPVNQLLSSSLSSPHAGNGDEANNNQGVRTLNNNPSPDRTPPSFTPQIRSDMKPRSTQRRLFDDDGPHDTDNAKRMRAATCITAHVRGYLTRRLFRTEDVQTVVQVIRDTLLFVMDLYREQMDSSRHQQPRRAMSDADVKLRRSLLQQLNSSCYMLHDIFIRKSVRDRMEIIATDRRIQRRRLEREAMTPDAVSGRLRTPVGLKTTPTRPLSSQQRHRLAQLAKITLFPMNIVATRSEITIRKQTCPAPMRRSKSLGEIVPVQTIGPNT